MILTPAGDRIFVPPKLRPPIVFNYHNGHQHLGSAKVIELIRRTYFWPNLDNEVINFIQSCSLCVARKGAAANQSSPMLHLSRPSGQWQIAYMDFFSFKEPVFGYKYALTYMCGFSRYLITVPVRNESAVACAKALVEHAFLPFTRPLILSCDRAAYSKAN